MTNWVFLAGLSSVTKRGTEAISQCRDRNTIFVLIIPVAPFSRPKHPVQFKRLICWITREGHNGRSVGSHVTAPYLSSLQDIVVTTHFIQVVKLHTDLELCRCSDYFVPSVLLATTF